MIHSHVGYKTEIHRHRPQYGGHQREGGTEIVKGKGVKHRVPEDDQTLGGGHTMPYTDHVSQRCTLEAYMIILTYVHPMNMRMAQPQKKSH